MLRHRDPGNTHQKTAPHLSAHMESPGPGPRTVAWGNVDPCSLKWGLWICLSLALRLRNPSLCLTVLSIEHRLNKHLATVMIAFCICCWMLSSGYSVATVLNCQHRDYPQEVCTGLGLLASAPGGEESFRGSTHSVWGAPSPGSWRKVGSRFHPGCDAHTTVESLSPGLLLWVAQLNSPVHQTKCGWNSFFSLSLALCLGPKTSPQEKLMQ